MSPLAKIHPTKPKPRPPYISWRFDDFLNACLVCCRAATSAPELPKRENPELAEALGRLDEIGAQIARLVEFIATGYSSSVDEKLREFEIEKEHLEQKVAALRSEELAKSTPCDQIDWNDTKALKQNIRAVVKRITAHPKDRWFRVELFDGRSVSYRENRDEIVIESDEAAAAGTGIGN